MQSNRAGLNSLGLNKKSIPFSTTKTTGISRAFDMKKFHLPSNFGFKINELLKLKKPLETRHESFICRTIRMEVEQQTLAPEMKVLEETVRNFLYSFPHLIFRDDLDSTVVSDSN